MLKVTSIRIFVCFVGFFYQLDLPSAVLNDEGDGAYLNGFITAPPFFDGQIEVKTFGTSVEIADTTENALGSSELRILR